MSSPSTVVPYTMEALCAVTEELPIGTNLDLLHFLWMQISGSLLPSRGALFPALQAIGLQPALTRRAWAAFRYGAWQIDDLLIAWEGYVIGQGQWRRYVLGLRSDIERHFAWVKRYFGLKYFQCYTFVRVSQFVLLTYIVVVAVALAAQRYQRPDLVRSRCAVLAHARP